MKQKHEYIHREQNLLMFKEKTKKTSVLQIQDVLSNDQSETTEIAKYFIEKL